MRRITLQVVLFAALLSLVGGCRPSLDEILPPITSHGANTFGCKVNKRLGYYAEKKCTYTFFELSCVDVSVNDGGFVSIKSTARPSNPKDYGSKSFHIYFHVDTIDGSWNEYCYRFRSTKYYVDEHGFTDIDVCEDSYVKLLRFDDRVIAGLFYVHFADGEIWYDGRFDVSFDN